MLTEQSVLAQEQETVLSHFGLADLNPFIQKLIEISGEDYEQVCVLIKLNKRPVFFHAGVATTNENNVWIAKKEHTVDQFDHSSLYEKLIYTENPAQFYQDSGLSPKDYAIVGGGLPIIVENTGIVGSLIISGLTDTGDHDLGYRTLLAYKSSLN
jgi:uncharacterized protein (UPF0303 family)